MKTVTATVGIFLFMTLCMANTVFADDDYDRCDRVPLQEARDAMVSDSDVTVTTVNVPSWADPAYYYALTPSSMTPTDGFIIYPGGYVDVRAYALLAHDIAKAGFLVALVPMPSCLAVTGKNRADAIIDNHPGITTWSIGGHSFGGVAACWYIKNLSGTFTNSDKIDGLVLWAAYPDSGQPIADTPIQAISLWGTKDALTTEQNIDDSEEDLPSDTCFIALKGANHTQFGWYGAAVDDYDFLTVGIDGVTVDNPADISRQEQHDLVASYTVNFLDSLTPDTVNIPAAVDEVTADDGSVWEQVSTSGFGDGNNTDIVSMCVFQGNLYALTRNDETGFELWKTTVGHGWQRITVQGFTDSNNYFGYSYYAGVTTKYNLNMNIWGDLIVFQDRLYAAVSTGYQGSALFGSLGVQIWRTDGVEWEPVIGHGLDHDEEGTLTAIAGCDDTSGEEYTATFTDSGKSWAVNSLAGCTLKVESTFTSATHGVSGLSVPGLRAFRIVSNTADTLTVQEAEKANTAQYTLCAEHNGGGDPGRPRNLVAGVTSGASYTIDCGADSRGFGDIWNKSIIDLEVLGDELFASIGLNYEQGARVMKTSDGVTWTADSEYSMGNIHGYDWNTGDAIPTGECPDSGYDATRDVPVSSSATKMVKTTVNDGEEKLFIGGTGTAGCNGRGARIYRRDDADSWLPIVDTLVDTNTTGTNENGFGWESGGDFFVSAFQAWSWAEYNGRLFVTIARLEGGGMIMHTETGSNIDGTWQFTMGSQPNALPPGVDPISVDPLLNPLYTGFGDVLNTGGYLHVYDGALYYGSLVTNQSMYYSNPIDGADMWKGVWDDDTESITWTPVNTDGFGDATVLQFQSFTDYGNDMYVAAATANSSNFHGQEPAGYTGARIYRMVSSSTIITLASLEARARMGSKIELRWTTTSEISTAGFNLYRATAENGPYEKITPALIPARGAPDRGADYTHTDTGLRPGTRYWYRLEDLNLDGNATTHGPKSATARVLPGPAVSGD